MKLLARRVCVLAAAVSMSAACGGKVVVDVSGTGVGASGGASSSSASSSSSSSGGTSCMVPSPGCAPDAYCGWSDKSCGGTDGSGACTARPTGCDKNLDPTCGCDGMIYGNPCEAQQAGTDFSDLGGCKAPPGMFGCGAHFCALGAYYCKRVAMSNGSTSTCEPAPAGCGGTASCDCLGSVGVECVGTCLSTMDGGILLACQKP